MKFAGVTAAGARGAMQQRRSRGRFVAPTMRTRYPSLNALRFDFIFSDRTGSLPSPQVTVFHPPAPAYFRFACTYGDCDGEFDLVKSVDVAVSSRDAQIRGQLRCAGTRQRGVACTLCLEFSILPQWA